MKQVLIVSHPRARSFTMAMAEAYAAAAQDEGGEVVVRDLYRQGFDPRYTPKNCRAMKALGRVRT